MMKKMPSVLRERGDAAKAAEDEKRRYERSSPQLLPTTGPQLPTAYTTLDYCSGEVAALEAEG